MQVIPIGLSRLLLLLCLFACIDDVAALNARGLSRVPQKIETIVAPDHSFPRWALVIGNSRYQHAPLINPVKDADAVGDRLARLGFNVIKVFDANTAALETAFERFAERLANEGGTAVFYFAGHGVQIRGENYLLATDTPSADATEVERHALRLGRVLKRLRAADNRRNLVILDACRNNPFLSGNEADGARGLADIKPSLGVLVAFSTSPGRVTFDGSDQPHSPYTAALLRHLETPDLGINEMLVAVRNDVLAATAEAQVPVEFSIQTHPLILNPQQTPTGAPPPTSAKDGLRGGTIWAVVAGEVTHQIEQRPLIESVLLTIAVAGIAIFLLSMLLSLFVGSGNDDGAEDVDLDGSDDIDDMNDMDDVDDMDETDDGGEKELEVGPGDEHPALPQFRQIFLLGRS